MLIVILSPLQAMGAPLPSPPIMTCLPDHPTAPFPNPQNGIKGRLKRGWRGGGGICQR
jgi:hypothetical protein